MRPLLRREVATLWWLSGSPLRYESCEASGILVGSSLSALTTLFGEGCTVRRDWEPEDLIGLLDAG